MKFFRANKSYYHISIKIIWSTPSIEMIIFRVIYMSYTRYIICFILINFQTYSNSIFWKWEIRNETKIVLEIFLSKEIFLLSLLSQRTKKEGLMHSKWIFEEIRDHWLRFGDKFSRTSVKEHKMSIEYSSVWAETLIFILKSWYGRLETRSRKNTIDSLITIHLKNNFSWILKKFSSVYFVTLKSNWLKSILRITFYLTESSMKKWFSTSDYRKNEK